MKKIWTKFIRFWYFNISNPVIRKGETEAFRWVFRRFFLTVETRSGNWRARWTASEYPFGYLLSSKTDENIIGFCQMIYTVGMMLTTDQGFVDDIAKAVNKYEKRLQKTHPVVEDETEEKIALEEVKQVEDYAKMASSERKKIDKKFKSAIKKIDNEE